ncbi:unnamed protein product [Trichogramma brassicae]|uniref:Uncharacterized protein n=1 Tax=Trichogramma brassicae TaxID=86971 RepID=A0A6H5I1W5_9HYME|nr:unnamed protein product [Trichogramma brassicae]
MRRKKSLHLRPHIDRYRQRISSVTIINSVNRDNAHPAVEYYNPKLDAIYRRSRYVDGIDDARQWRKKRSQSRLIRRACRVKTHHFYKSTERASSVARPIYYYARAKEKNKNERTRKYIQSLDIHCDPQIICIADHFMSLLLYTNAPTEI